MIPADHITVLEVRLSPHELDHAANLIALLERIYPAMTVDDAVDFIFKVGMLHLSDQNIVALDAPSDADAPFGQAGQMVAAVLR